jgi:hypothetical protein
MRIAAPLIVGTGVATAASSAAFSSPQDLRHLAPTSRPPEEINVIRLAWEDLAA